MVAKISLEDILDDLASLSLEEDTPPPNSFHSGQFFKKLLAKDPSMTRARSDGKIERLIAEGKIVKSERQYLNEDRRKVYYYTPKAGGA